MGESVKQVFPGNAGGLFGFAAGTPRISALIALCLAVVGGALFWRLRVVFAAEVSTPKDATLFINVLLPFLVLSFGCLVISVVSILLTSRQQRLLSQDEGRIEATEQVADLMAKLDEEHMQSFSSWIHDSIGHGLVLLRMDIEHLVVSGRLAVSDVSNATGHLDSMLAEVRGMASSLYPKIISEVGLSAALESLLGNFSKMSHIEVDSAIGELDGIEDNKKRAFAIYRTVQECLTNAARHGAAFVWVAVRRRGAEVRGTVLSHGETERGGAAEGAGPSPDASGIPGPAGFQSRRGGLGLELMELRLRRIGGSLTRGWAAEGVFRVEFVA